MKVLREKGYADKKVIFGIRAENLNSEPAFLETFPNAVVNATVTISELLGADSHLYCKVGDNEFISRVDARDHIKPGSSISIGFDVNKGHFFDINTEQTIY